MRARNEFGLVKRKINGKVVYYYYVYDESNRRVYRSTGERNKAKAMDYILSLRDKGRLGVKDRSMVLLKDFAEDFFIPEKCPIVKNAEMRGKGVAKSSCYTWRNALENHILPHLGNVPVSSINKARINKWLLELPVKDKVSRTSANSYYDTLRKVMDEAVREGLLESNPCEKVERLGNDSTRTKAFTVADVKKVIGTEQDWDNALIRLMCLTAAMTGMRVSEVRALRPDDITDTAIYIRHSFSEQDGLKTTKSKKDRVAPIPPSLRDLLRKYFPADGGFIFRIVGDKPVSSSYVLRKLKERMEKVGVKDDRTFHSFRTFVNTQLEADNVNETIVRSVIGHQNADMTEHYLHLEAGEFLQVRNTQDRILREILA